MSLSAEEQETAKIKQLALSDKWLALLHFNTQSANQESYVDDTDFFLEKDGATEPLKELLATISALKSDSSVQCKFPARTLFILENISALKPQIEPVSCTKYLDWRAQLNTSSIVLVFAATQLNSPSSMYGHTFLRFDPDNVDKNSTYLSYALNFGATVPEVDGGFLYAARGLTGGYPGNFAANPYFEKIKEYNKLENRDLWEYKLNLNADEINFMLAHVWELQGINFDYYFFDENCSFRLLELLDVARPGHFLANQFPLTAMPLDTVRVVEAANLIENIHYRPSILTELEAQLDLLLPQQRDLVYELAQDINVLSNTAFTSLTIEQQQIIVDSAYRYLRYQNTFNGRPKAVTRRSFLLLKRLNEHPRKLSVTIDRPIRPDKGHKTTMLGVSAGQNAENTFVELNYRGSYHDLLDPIGGYYQGMSLNMLNLKVRAYEGGDIKLEKFELLDIVSLSSRNRFFSPWSWKANVSLEQQWTIDKEILVTQGTAGRGLSFEFFDNSHFFSFATARIEVNHKLADKIALAPGLQLGLLHYWSKASLMFDVEHYQFLFDQTMRSQLNIQQSFELGKNHSLRLSAQFHRVKGKKYKADYFDEFSLEYRHYF
jgi:hypothetical protein